MKMILIFFTLLHLLYLCLPVAQSTRTGVEILNSGLIDLQKQSISDFVDSPTGKVSLIHYVY